MISIMIKKEMSSFSVVSFVSFVSVKKTSFFDFSKRRHRLCARDSTDALHTLAILRVNVR